MDSSPNNEPVKTGFTLAADQNVPGKETDADEQVHEQPATVPELSGEQDMDDLVHEHFSPAVANLMEEKEEEDQYSGEEDVDEGGEG